MLSFKKPMKYLSFFVSGNDLTISIAPFGILLAGIGVA